MRLASLSVFYQSVPRARRLGTSFTQVVGLRVGYSAELSTPRVIKMSTEVVIREGTREDVPQIMKLIMELAIFEKMPEAVKINAEILERDGFDTQPPPFMAYAVEDKNKPGVLIAYSICNLAYATWYGKRFYIEDIMVTEAYRGKGVGRKLFAHLCKEALRMGCVVINFTMISWNPAREFYRKMGAKDITQSVGWHWNVIHKAEMENVVAKYCS